ncbi:hypothetical protein C8R46DRAFT_1037943 [Mycena filopes]|nr:hypothetical protein C8R46DRAFT_1037943 [Mycena filopes]
MARSFFALSTELIDLIAVSASRPDLLSLSRTNSKVYAVCLRQIYRESSPVDARAVVLFFRTMISNTQAASYVRKLTIYGESRRSGGQSVQSPREDSNVESNLPMQTGHRLSPHVPRFLRYAPPPPARLQDPLISSHPCLPATPPKAYPPVTTASAEICQDMPKSAQPNLGRPRQNKATLGSVLPKHS